MAGRSSKGGSEDLAAVLRERREAIGMSRRDLADASGLSYPYISQLETAYRLPSPRAMQSLARALQMPVTHLFDALPLDPLGPLEVPADAPQQELVELAAELWDSSPDSGSPWVANPAHQRMSRMSQSPPRIGRREAAQAAIESLEALEPADRLAALNEVQAAVVAGVVRDLTAGPG